MMSRVGRNEPCVCGSGRKTKRCCGVRSGPSDGELARAGLAASARTVAPLLAGHDEWELVELCDEMLALPRRDLSLLVTLPRLFGAALERLCRAVADDDVDRVESALPAALAEVDSAVVRVRLARAALELARGHPEVAEVAAAAVIDLASGSHAFMRASLVQAVAVAVGASRTPSGLVVVSA